MLLLPCSNGVVSRKIFVVQKQNLKRVMPHVLFLQTTLLDQVGLLLCHQMVEVEVVHHQEV